MIKYRTDTVHKIIDLKQNRKQFFNISYKNKSLFFRVLQCISLFDLWLLITFSDCNFEQVLSKINFSILLVVANIPFIVIHLFSS